MFISAGCFFLVGGVWGAVANAVARKFYKSDFANREFLIPEEDYRTEVPVSPRQRWALVGLCAAIAVAGVIWIQHDHNWKPLRFENLGFIRPLGSLPTASRSYLWSARTDC